MSFEYGNMGLISENPKNAEYRDAGGHRKNVGLDLQKQTGQMMRCINLT